MRINDWPLAERPRERLLDSGPNSLSDAELLAILLRTGQQGQSALDLARALIQHFGNLRGLLEADQKQLCAQPGLGPAKVAQIQAALELARRHLQARLERGDALTSPNDTRKFLIAKLRHQPHEQFCALMLDTRNRVIRFETLFHGSIDVAHVHPRVVAERALKAQAASVIIAHNHPSGVAEPSQADLAITRKLRDALGLLDIRLLDHFIVGDGDVVSLAERGQV